MNVQTGETESKENSALLPRKLLKTMNRLL